MSQRDLDLISKWLMESPRNRALEALMVLAFLMFPIQFWLAEQITNRRNKNGKR